VIEESSHYVLFIYIKRIDQVKAHIYHRQGKHLFY